MISLDTFTGGSFARQITDQKGNYSVLEYNKNTGFAALNPEKAHFFSKMGIKKKQVIVELNGNSVILQAGGMQMMLGNVTAETNVQGVGDMFARAFASRATGESAIKPKYSGTGFVVLEPTWKFILLENLAEWGGSMTIDDGLFLACESKLKHKAVMRSNLSSAALGNEGLFNLGIQGSGILALECHCPREELIEVVLQNDVLKVDGNFAIAWSGSLDFTVERSGKSLIGSAASGEGLVNVYRGTGKVWLAPVQKGLA